MVRLITEHRAEQVAERLRAGNLWEDAGFVFATEFGSPVDPRNLLRTTTLAAKRARLPQIGVHTLRHTYATTALLNNVPMHVVSRNLGHSSIMITADIYGHLTDEAARSRSGVPAELRERMFEPFQRLHDRSTTQGLGLGLAIARGFTEAMGVGSLHPTLQAAASP